MGIPARCLLLAALLFAPLALGTEQVPDTLLLDGEHLSLRTHPLEGWLKQHPDTLPKAKYDPSNNYRGYIATWEVAGGKLLLRKVEVSVGEREGEWDGVDESWPYLYEDVRATLFPGESEVLASWFSGTFELAKGKRYTLLWICAGQLRRRADVDADGYLKFLDERRKALKRHKRTDADWACAPAPAT